MFRIDNTVTTTLDYPDLIIQTLHEPGANRLALLDLDWDLDCLDRHRDRDRKDMTSGREKPESLLGSYFLSAAFIEYESNFILVE
jgi:hypothetical protein